LGQVERRALELRAVGLPLRLELALVRPAELDPCPAPAECGTELARGRVHAAPHRVEPHARRERGHLLRVVRGIRQAGARLAAHSSEIGRHCTSQSSRWSKQNSTSTGTPKPASAWRTTSAIVRTSSSRKTRTAPAARARTRSPSNEYRSGVTRPETIASPPPSAHSITS